MSNADFLRQAFSIISSRSADIEEKMDRLRRAKQQIIDEQSESMNEIKKIREPSLNPLWDGARASAFAEDREDAYETIEKIIRDYDNVVRQIEWKITELSRQKDFLDTTSSIAYAADHLFRKGEEAVEELGRKISQLKGRLFG